VESVVWRLIDAEGRTVATEQTFQYFADRWLNEQPGFFTRQKRKAQAWAYNRIPRELRFSGLMAAVSKLLLICAPPGTAYATGTLNFVQAVVAGGLLTFLNISSYVFSKISSFDRKSPNESEMIVRLGDLLSSISKGSVPSQERATAIRACLGLIENASMGILRLKKGDISVSLVVFSGTGEGKMKVAFRNPGNIRPENRECESRYLLGYHVCKRGTDPRILNDIKQFKGTLKSPTQQKPNYRSIFLIPLEADIGDTRCAKGFVSIDCGRPFAFWGNKANAIVISCVPIVTHLGRMI
jgi:hypothetical protein